MNSSISKLFRRRLEVALLPFLAILVGAFLLVATSDKHSESNIADAAPLRPLYPEEQRQMALMRPAGINGNRTGIPMMLAVLTDPMKPRPMTVDAIPQPVVLLVTPHPSTVKTALHALAQLGATEALPIIDIDLKENTVDPSYARVERARLVAENEATGVSSGTAQVKINRFYKELGLTRADLNTAAIAYEGNSRLGKHSPSAEVYAMREIADMAYRGSYSDYAVLPAVNQLNFQSDYPSALKIRLAPLTKADRVKTMVDDLAHTQSIGPKQKYEMQLLDDEGILASRAAAAQLQQMDSHRNQYPREGFEAIFSVLSGAGDSTQAPLVEHYTQDQDGYIAYFASNAYPDVKAGHSGIFAPDY